MLDVPTTRVAYVKVTPTISNWIQPIAIELQVWTALRLDRDRIAIGSRSSCQCGQALINSALFQITLVHLYAIVAVNNYLLSTLIHLLKHKSIFESVFPSRDVRQEL